MQELISEYGLKVIQAYMNYIQVCYAVVCVNIIYLEIDITSISYNIIRRMLSWVSEKC